MNAASHTPRLSDGKGKEGPVSDIKAKLICQRIDYSFDNPADDCVVHGF